MIIIIIVTIVKIPTFGGKVTNKNKYIHQS